MTSLIDLFNGNSKLSYTLSSSKASSGYEATYAFDKDKNYYFTTDTSFFWQITFSRSVIIESYNIGGSSTWSSTLMSWDVSYSRNKTEINFIQTDSANTLIGTSKRCTLNTKIACTSFRITRRTVSNGGWFGFNKFDCFGRVEKIKNQVTCRSSLFLTMIQKNTILILILSV